MVLAEGGFDALPPRFPTGRTCSGLACPVPQLPALAPPHEQSSGDEKVKFPQKGGEEKKPNNFWANLNVFDTNGHTGCPTIWLTPEVLLPNNNLVD